MMVGKKYTAIEDCRGELKRYSDSLKTGSDDFDDSKRDMKSWEKYNQDIRWFNDWMNKNGVDEITDIGTSESHSVGISLSQEFNGPTGFQRFCLIRRMFEHLVLVDVVDENPFEKWNLKESFGLSKTSEQSKHIKSDENYGLSPDEIEILMQNPGRHVQRNRLLIKMMWQTGMRRGEVSNLKIGDIDREEREITIRKENAKNDKSRVVGFQDSLDGYLGVWLDDGLREEMMSGRGHDYVFCGERGGRLRGDAVNEIVKQSAIRGGINRKLDYDSPSGTRWLITSHNIRHGYASYLINKQGADIYKTSKLLGHSSVEMTERKYVNHDKRVGVEMVKKLGPD